MNQRLCTLRHCREEQACYRAVLGGPVEVPWLCRHLGCWQQVTIRHARSNKWVSETPSVDLCSPMANIRSVALHPIAAAFV